MIKKQRLVLLAFAAVSCIELVGEMAPMPNLVFYTKPLLMPLLALWFWLETSSSMQFVRRAVLGALVLSTFGDVFLMFTNDARGELFFLLGLGSFFFTHIFYIGGFLSSLGKAQHFLKRNPAWILVFLGYAAALLSWLWQGLSPGLHLPVAVYALVLCGTGLSVLNLYNRLPRSIFGAMMAGALLFILSDSLIAVARFGHPFQGARLAIMVTYLAGQYLLVASARFLSTNVPDTGQSDHK